MVREGDEETVGGETAQRILIVDDAPLNRAILREMLGVEFQTAEAAGRRKRAVLLCAARGAGTEHHGAL